MELGMGCAARDAPNADCGISAKDYHWRIERSTTASFALGSPSLSSGVIGMTTRLVLVATIAATWSCCATFSVAATPEPTQVTIAGSLQSELGCPGDWQPGCAQSSLSYDSADTVWQAAFGVPAGAWEYKAALNGTWDENYGANAQPDGGNIPLNLAAPASVKFYYDHATHWITDNANSVIATVPGSFQSELGCPGDWQPDCLRSWLQDPDGDGTYAFSVTGVPAGDYEAKVAIDEGWAVNYGAGGVQNGPNIPFTVVSALQTVTFTYDAVTHVLVIDVGGAFPGQPLAVTIAGNLQSELGCAGDWDPTCDDTQLAFDAEDVVWQRAFNVPAGAWEYKAALDEMWTENYGANATANGANIPFGLMSATPVKFYYDHASHWVTDNVGTIIATVPGSFQSELGCTGDWDPTCLRSWLQDTDGDGTYTRTVTGLPAGMYECKVAIDESWTENYGAGGAPGGANLPFAVPNESAEVLFSWNSVSKVLTISVNGVPVFEFEGFFAPVLNLPAVNVVRAGAAVPVKFSLDGDQGLDIFAAGSPTSTPVACDASDPVGAIEETVTAGASGLSYDATTGQYIYVWKTRPAWAGSCRELVLTFTDGSVQRAQFQFRR